MSGNIDGVVLANWARRAAAELAAQRAEINELNVFPVPDSDTGSNMAHTMESAVAELEGQSIDSAAQVAAALARGAVRGARGNSGIVLSQVLRSIAHTAAAQAIGSEEIAESLALAVRLVENAIQDPVEGTVLTVLRAASEASSDSEASNMVSAAAEAARVALERTPSQLKALREAGVVDAGGRGLTVLLDSLEAELDGRPAVTAKPAGHPQSWRWPTEVMCHIQDTDLNQLAANLKSIGDSVVIGRETDTCGIAHVHTTDPGKAVDTMIAAGNTDSFRFELLPSSTRHIITAVPEGSFKELLAETGAIPVANAEELAEVLENSVAQEIILLGNGILSRGDIVEAERLAARYSIRLNPVLTRLLVDGLAALAVYNPAHPIGFNGYAMAEAATSMKVTTALSADDTDDLAKRCALLLDDASEQVTVLVDKQISDHLAEELTAQLGVETVVYHAQNMVEAVQIGVE